jgi:glycosyltransferase involved in cell wall biosynthesis
MQNNLKPKIIQLTTFFHPVTGGVETQVEEISEALIHLGYEVEVFTSDSNRTGNRIPDRQSRLGKIKITRFKTWFSLSKYHKCFPGVFFKLLSTKYDVIHVHGIRKPEFYLALIAAKLRHKKIVVTTHNPFTADNYRQGRLNTLIKLHDATLGRWFTKYIDKMIYISPSEKFILEKKFNLQSSQLAYIPNGINEIYFNKSELPESEVLKLIQPLNQHWDGIVLAACRMNEVKGLQNLKKAVDKLDKVLFLFVGGDDGYLGKLKAIYRNNPNVFFSEKYLSKELIRSIMDIADLFVLPSLHEPFGLTIVEAAATGLPVIATKVGGPVDVLDKSFARFLDPHDQTEWDAEISKMIYSKVNKNLTSSVGKNFVQKYRWTNIIPQLEKIYS